MKITNENKLSFFKKITGTNIADLAGLNKFKPRGDAVLSIMGVVKEPFDKFYTKRGEIAEQLALLTLQKRGYNCVVYEKKSVEYDNFPENPYFGGLIDIEIPSLNTLYEIKSKSIKDYEKISKYGDSVQEEQAMHYGWLRKYKQVHIMWIFFDEQSEYEILNNRPLSTYRNLKMFEKTLDIDFDYQTKIHHEALHYYIDCLAKCEVDIDDISDKYLDLLKLKRPDKNTLQNGNRTI